MKKLVIVTILAFLMAIGILVAVALPIYSKGHGCMSDYQRLISDDCLTFIHDHQPLLDQANRFLNLPILTEASQLITKTQPFWPYRDYLLGNSESGTTYLLLLQNNYELRTNGGFFGSYAVITMKNGQPQFRFEDIYTPDGQLPGHVEPPAPIQEAFQSGEFRLQNSDWLPDFPQDAATIRWFFTHGKEVDPDIMATLSFDTIKSIVAITGPIEIPEYNTMIDSENFYLTIQTKTEVNHFPGSTQKRDIVGATGKALINKLNSLPRSKQLLVINYLFSEIKNKNILLNSLNPDFQSLLVANDYAGVWQPQQGCSTTSDCISETFGVVEANMGANKSNKYIDRSTTHQVYLEGSAIRHNITLNFSNSSTQENPDPPLFYGGNYIDYLRIYLPSFATDIKIEAHPTLPTTLVRYPTPYDSNTGTGTVRQNTVFGFQEIGFFHITQAGTNSSVRISYTLPYANQSYYQLKILKQHGLATSPTSLDLFGTKDQAELRSDFTSPAIKL